MGASQGEPERLPPVPMLPGDANEELRKRMVAQPAGKWKEAVDHIVNSRWRMAAEVLESMRPVQRWLRDYLLASVWLWWDDAERAEEVARRLRRVADTAPVAQMLLWDIYRQLSFIYFQRLLDEYPQSGWAHF